ncbi:MAG: EF-P lysine aminoacylase GenX [Chromatiales bacterium]|nr:MAG: EF-P lysine aminoacylase GenX [Chromatiales bacterium]
MNDWRPATGPEAARSRAAMLRRVRNYFDTTNVLEVDTPALSRTAVSDIQIESLEITDCAVGGGPLFLHTSPEFCMKRLLAAGYPDIFSIARVFRDGEAGRKHQPEFTMLEWYRLDMGLSQIIQDTTSLIGQVLADAAPTELPVRIDYYDAFLNTVGVDARTASLDKLIRAADADEQLQAALGRERDDWLDLLLATRVIPSFAANRLTVLQHYPASQAALARLCPGDPDVADRFEIFLGPLELANGYVELTDAAEQAARIASDIESRKRRGQIVRPVDQNLLAALAAGLPQCAGVAMGLERLQMLCDKTDDIRDVISFTFEEGA